MPNNEQIKRIAILTISKKVNNNKAKKPKIISRPNRVVWTDWDVKNVRSNQWRKKKDVYYAVCAYTHWSKNCRCFELDFYRDSVNVAPYQQTVRCTVHGAICACVLYKMFVFPFPIPFSVFINNGETISAHFVLYVIFPLHFGIAE